MNPALKDWRGKTVWLLGASSGIGRALASALHRAGARVVVSARNAGALEAFAQQHPGARALPLDAVNRLALGHAFNQLKASGSLDVVVYCAGHYAEMDTDNFNLEEMTKHLQVNYLGALNLLDVVLPYFKARGSGHISLVGSVAGYRGLPKSLAYGPTKAALANLAEALYLDLRGKGVAVSLISPGFVDTPLTAQNDFEMPALISPEQAAAQIMRGWANGEFEIHFPKRFTRVMKLARLLPYRLYFAAIRRWIKP